MAVDIGPRIGIDGEAEFRKQINNLTQQVRTFDTELDALSAEMNANGESEEALTRKSEILNRAIEAQEQKIQELRKGLEFASREFGENDERTLKWAQAVNNANRRLSQLRNEVNNNEDALNHLGDETREAGDEFDSAGERASSFGDTLKAVLTADVITSSISAVVDMVKELGAALYDFSLENENATKKATAYFGETGAAAEQTEKVIKDVWTGGVGDSMEEVADAVIMVKNNLDGLSQTDLTNLTNQAMTLDSLYGIDMNETLRGVNSLMSQFGIDAQTAMDYIVAGTRNGLDKTQELGDNLSEYAGKFAQAGYSAEEYFQLLNNGLDGGAYNLDKVNDAINEVTTRLADDTISDAIGMYSDETQRLFQAWQNGEASQKQVIDSIVSDISKAENQQDALNMAATAFGTMAEDGNLKFIESLTSVGNTYSDVTGKAQEMFDATTTSSQAMTAAMRGLQEQFLPVGDAMVAIVAQLVTGFTTLASGIDLSGFAENILGAFNFVISILQQVSTGAMSISDGFGIILNAVIEFLFNIAQSVIEALPDMLLAGMELITSLEEGYLSQFPAFVENGAQLILNFANSMLENLPQFLEAGVQFVQTVIQGVVDMIPTLAEQGPVLVVRLVASLLENLPQILETGNRLVGELAAGIIQAIPEIVKAMPQVISAVTDEIGKHDWIQLGKDILNGLVDGILGGVGAVVDAAREAAGEIKEAFCDFFDIHSPSRVMRDEVGRQLTAGIAEGILSNADYAIKSAEEVGAAILSAAQQKLDNYQVYNNMTLAEEVGFWDEIRSQVQEGTQARIDADEKYLSAKKNLTSQLEDIEETYKDNVSKVYKELDENIEAAWENYRNQVESVEDSLKSQMSLFDEFDYSTEQTTQGLIDNLASQVEGITVWRNSLNKLASRGIPSGLFDELEEMGVSAAGQIQLLSEMTDDELNSYISLWSSKNGLVEEAAREQTEPLLEETKQQIAEMRETAKEELQAYQDEFVRSMEDIGAALVQPLEEIKNQLIQNYADTVGTVADTVDAQANDTENQEKYAQIAENIINASSGLPDSFYSLGQQTIEGIINGLNSQTSQLYLTMTQIADGIVQAAQSALDIHSPSRVMKDFIGKNIVEGLSEGMLKYRGIAANAAQQLYGSVTDNFSVPIMANGTAAAYDRLASQMGNMQIVLSDGTLVGKLTPQIDAALGGYTKIKGRYYT